MLLSYLYLFTWARWDCVLWWMAVVIVVWECLRTKSKFQFHIVSYAVSMTVALLSTPHSLFFLYWTCLASRTRRPACQQAAVIVGDWRYSGKPWRGLQLWFPRSPPQRVGETERRGLYSSVIIVGMTMKRIKLCWAVVWGASEPLFRVHLKIIP